MSEAFAHCLLLLQAPQLLSHDRALTFWWFITHELMDLPPSESEDWRIDFVIEHGLLTAFALLCNEENYNQHLYEAAIVNITFVVKSKRNLPKLVDAKLPQLLVQVFTRLFPHSLAAQTLNIIKTICMHIELHPMLFELGVLELAKTHIKIRDQVFEDRDDTVIITELACGSILCRLGAPKQAVELNPEFLYNFAGLLKRVVMAGEGALVLQYRWNVSAMLFDALQLAKCDELKPLMVNFVGILTHKLMLAARDNKPQVVQWAMAALFELFCCDRLFPEFERIQTRLIPQLTHIRDTDLSGSLETWQQASAILDNL